MSVVSTVIRNRRLARLKNAEETETSEPAQDVICPVCGATGSEPCITTKGKIAKKWHKARREFQKQNVK